VWGNQSTVQLDHRVYNAEKACSAEDDVFNIVHNPLGDANCPPNTWHWDNVSIAPAVPFSVIRPTRDFDLTDPSPQTVTFTAAAAANTNLEFITAGQNSAIQVSFDNGRTWLPGRLQPATMPGHDEAAEMVWMPVPIGTQSLQVRGANGFWGGYSSSGFNLISAAAGVVRTVPTDTPTPVAQGGGGQPPATATPSPTLVSSAPATRTSTPTATPTTTPTRAATSAPVNPPVSTSRRSLMVDGSTAFAEAAARPELNLTRSWTIETWFKDRDPDGYRHAYRMLIDKGEEAASEVQVAKQTLGGRAGSGNALAVEIGRQGQGSTSEKSFLGSIDDVRIWNVVRSSADIQANFRRELSAPAAGLVANWQFNSLSSGVTSNLVASGPGATLHGAAFLSADVHP